MDSKIDSGGGDSTDLGSTAAMAPKPTPMAGPVAQSVKERAFGEMTFRRKKQRLLYLCPHPKHGGNWCSACQSYGSYGPVLRCGLCSYGFILCDLCTIGAASMTFPHEDEKYRWVSRWCTRCFQRGRALMKGENSTTRAIQAETERLRSRKRLVDCTPPATETRAAVQATEGRKRKRTEEKGSKTKQKYPRKKRKNEKTN